MLPLLLFAPAIGFDALDQQCFAASDISPMAFRGAVDDAMAFLLRYGFLCSKPAVHIDQFHTSIGCAVEAAKQVPCQGECSVSHKYFATPKELRDGCRGWLHVSVNALRQRFTGKTTDECYLALMDGAYVDEKCDLPSLPKQPIGGHCFGEQGATLVEMGPRADIWALLLKVHMLRSCGDTTQYAISVTDKNAQIGCVEDINVPGRNCHGSCPTNTLYHRNLSLAALPCQGQDWLLVSVSPVHASHRGNHNIDCYEALSHNDTAAVREYCGPVDAVEPLAAADSLTVSDLKPKCTLLDNVEVTIVASQPQDIFALALQAAGGCPGSDVAVNITAGVGIAGCLKDSNKLVGPQSCTGSCPVRSNYFRDPDILHRLGCQGEALIVDSSKVLDRHTGLKTPQCYQALVSGTNEQVLSFCGPSGLTFVNNDKGVLQTTDLPASQSTARSSTRSPAGESFRIGIIVLVSFLFVAFVILTIAVFWHGCGGAVQDEKDAYDESEVDPNDSAVLAFEVESHEVLEEGGSFRDEEPSAIESSSAGVPSAMAYPLAFTIMNVKQS